MTEDERDEVARILEIVAKDGLPEPRDLDVALDAIEAALSPSPELAQLVKAARALLANLTEGDFISITRIDNLTAALVPFKEVE